MEYDESYFVSRGNVRHQYNAKIRRRIQKSRSQILDVLNHVEPGPLLDVGCARGSTLRAAEEHAGGGGDTLFLLDAKIALAEALQEGPVANDELPSIDFVTIE